MYIDASDSCNSLTFQIGSVITFTRQWNIKVTQYAMDFPNKAPKGCLQYHFTGDGNDDGVLDPTVIRSFNWNGGTGRHLANQDYNICIRREATNTRVCYSQDATSFLNDFLISAGVAGDAGTSFNSASCLFGKASGLCGSYGSSGVGKEFDHLQIPRATQFTGLAVGLPAGGPIATGVNDNFCGDVLRPQRDMLRHTLQLVHQLLPLLLTQLQSAVVQRPSWCDLSLMLEKVSWKLSKVGSICNIC